MAETQEIIDALRFVMGSVRDTAPSGRIAVSKVERIIQNKIAHLRNLEKSGKL